MSQSPQKERSGERPVGCLDAKRYCDTEEKTNSSQQCQHCGSYACQKKWKHGTTLSCVQRQKERMRRCNAERCCISPPRFEKRVGRWAETQRYLENRKKELDKKCKALLESNTERPASIYRDCAKSYGSRYGEQSPKNCGNCPTGNEGNSEPIVMLKVQNDRLCCHEMPKIPIKCSSPKETPAVLSDKCGRCQRWYCKAGKTNGISDPEEKRQENWEPRRELNMCNICEMLREESPEEKKNRWEVKHSGLLLCEALNLEVSSAPISAQNSCFKSHLGTNGTHTNDSSYKHLFEGRYFHCLNPRGHGNSKTKSRSGCDGFFREDQDLPPRGPSQTCCTQSPMYNRDNSTWQGGRECNGRTREHSQEKRDRWDPQREGRREICRQPFGSPRTMTSCSDGGHCLQTCNNQSVRQEAYTFRPGEKHIGCWKSNWFCEMAAEKREIFGGQKSPGLYFQTKGKKTESHTATLCVPCQTRLTCCADGLTALKQPSRSPKQETNTHEQEPLLEKTSWKSGIDERGCCVCKGIKEFAKPCDNAVSDCARCDGEQNKRFGCEEGKETSISQEEPNSKYCDDSRPCTCTSTSHRKTSESSHDPETMAQPTQSLEPQENVQAGEETSDFCDLEDKKEVEESSDLRDSVPEDTNEEETYTRNTEETTTHPKESEEENFTSDAEVKEALAKEIEKIIDLMSMVYDEGNSEIESYEEEEGSFLTETEQYPDTSGDIKTTDVPEEDVGWEEVSADNVEDLKEVTPPNNEHAKKKNESEKEDTEPASKSLSKSSRSKKKSKGGHSRKSSVSARSRSGSEARPSISESTSGISRAVKRKKISDASKRNKSTSTVKKKKSKDSRRNSETQDTPKGEKEEPGDPEPEETPDADKKKGKSRKSSKEKGLAQDSDHGTEPEKDGE